MDQRFFVLGNRVPYEYFLTKGKGESNAGSAGLPYETGSYDAALNDAGIQNSNVIEYTSVIPVGAKEITKEDDNSLWSDYKFVDSNKNYIHVWLSDKFVSSNLIQSPDGTFKFYNSDPEVAHENCTFRRFKNYHMIDGKIYKCGPAALMPKFVEQNKFELSQDDRDLLNSYKPLSVDATDEEMQDFFSNIDNMIPQCKFCPEQYQYKTIEFSNLKKSWKINNREDTT